MRHFVKNLFAKTIPATRRPPRTQLGLLSLEERANPATLGVTNRAVLDFSGEAQLSQAAFAEGGWNLPSQQITSFRRLFTVDARPFLDRDGSGQVNDTDRELVIQDIVAKVRQDYAPYNLEIVVGERSDNANLLTDSTVGDVMVFVTGGQDFIAPQIGRTAANGWAPGVDIVNDGDQMAFVIGASIADDAGGNYDRFVNIMARTISHEMGHTFGLAHIDQADPSDAQTHHLMNIVDRDFSRDFGFQDQAFDTASGSQNAHQILSQENVLGRSANPWTYVLQPGVLTVSGGAEGDTIRVDRLSPAQWRTTVNAMTQTINLNSANLASFNPFDQAIARVSVFGQGGDDSIVIGATMPAAFVEGGMGNDTITGGNGDDILRGGLGNDTLRGGEGQDVLFGDFGTDFLDGQGGNDRLDGGFDGLRDILNGGQGNDTFVQHGVFPSFPEDTILDAGFGDTTIFI